MKLKTYQVSSLAEAIGKIKTDLGPNAVILSTKKVAEGTLGWLAGKSRIEVTAALDETNEPVAVKPKAKEISNLSMEPFRQELAEIKRMLAQVIKVQQRICSQTAKDQDGDFASEPIYNIYQRLQQQGVHVSLLKQLVDDLLLSENVGDTSLEDYVSKYLCSQIPNIENVEHEILKHRTIALVGPTGSGKTTTLAKLAVMLHVQHKRKIALVSLDQFRIGASFQLKEYADILGVPCLSVNEKNPLTSILEQLEHYDHVLVDTTGRSQNDQQALQELANTLQLGESVYIACVIPAHLRESDLKQCLKSFAITKFNQLIISKLDETMCFGNLLNATHLSGVPLAYFTTGQNVPEDIEIASVARMLDCLFDFSGNYANYPSAAEVLQ